MKIGKIFEQILLIWTMIENKNMKILKKVEQKL